MQRQYPFAEDAESSPSKRQHTSPFYELAQPNPVFEAWMKRVLYYDSEWTLCFPTAFCAGGDPFGCNSTKGLFSSTGLFLCTYICVLTL